MFNNLTSEDVVMTITDNEGNKIEVEPYECEGLKPGNKITLTHVNGNEVVIPVTDKVAEQLIKKGFVDVR